MLWDDNNDSEEWQIFKNMAFLNFIGTNKERDEFINSPAFSIIMGIIVVGFLIFIVLSITGTIK